VDRFGNLTTSVLARALGWDPSAAEGCAMVALISDVAAPLVTTYSDVGEGAMCALVGSSGRIEIAVNAGSAARLTGAARGAPVILRRLRRPPAI
jgi:S-adenosylmethionine hydrolase